MKTTPELPPLPKPLVQNFPSGKWSYHESQMRDYVLADRASRAGEQHEAIAEDDLATAEKWIAERAPEVAFIPAPTPVEPAPVKWGDPENVGMLIRQLQTLDPTLPVYAAFHTEYRGKRRAFVRGVTVSREHVAGRLVESGPPVNSIVVWTAPVEPWNPVNQARPDGWARGFTIPVELPDGRIAKMRKCDLIGTDRVAFIDSANLPPAGEAAQPSDEQIEAVARRTHSSWDFAEAADRAELHAFARSLLAEFAPPAVLVEPAGFKLVPIEPTEAMRNAAFNALGHYEGGSQAAVAGGYLGVWAQMLAAAPAVPPITKKA